MRGLPIAIENLLNCLLLTNVSQDCDYHLFCGDPEISFLRWLEANASPPLSRFHIHNAATLTRGGAFDQIGLWWEPGSNYGLVYQLRDRLAGHAYPIIAAVHGISIHTGLLDHFGRVLLCDSYPNDSFVCSSVASRQALEKLLESLTVTLEERYGVKRRFLGRLDLIPLPVDTNSLKPADKALAKRRLNLPTGCTLLLYFGLVSPLKADLFPCVLALADRVEDVTRHDLVFCIAGGGDDEYVKKLLAFARDTGFPTSRLRFVRNPSDTLKRTLFEAADIFTSPADSVQEAFGLSVIEAMAYGVPQVVANWSGYRDIVQHGVTGFLIPTLWARCDHALRDTGLLLGWTHDHQMLGQSVAMNADLWRDAILSLAGGVELRKQMSYNARKRASAFSVESIRKRYLDLWRELAGDGRPARDFHNTPQLERPRYYDWFQHFASTPIGGNLKLSGIRHTSRETVLKHSSGLNRGVQREVVEQIFRSVDAQQNPTVDDLVQALRIGIEPSTVQWHVMWALKQGLLQAASDRNAG